jgi:AcrR family transcriptional regulator
MKKGEKTKRKLLDTAMELLGKYEIDEITVDAIVAAAGVAKGTFYIYFESKDALIAALLFDYVSSVDADYRTHLDSLPSGMTASDMLLSLIAKISDVLVGEIGCHKMGIVYRVQLTGAYDMDVVKGYNRKLYQIFAAVLGKGLERGEFSTKIPAEILIKHFVMAIRGLTYEWCIRYPDFDLKEEALTHFRILLSGIRNNEKICRQSSGNLDRSSEKIE